MAEKSSPTHNNYPVHGFMLLHPYFSKSNKVPTSGEDYISAGSSCACRPFHLQEVIAMLVNCHKESYPLDI